MHDSNASGCFTTPWPIQPTYHNTIGYEEKEGIHDSERDGGEHTRFITLVRWFVWVNTRQPQNGWEWEHRHCNKERIDPHRGYDLVHRGFEPKCFLSSFATQKRTLWVCVLLSSRLQTACALQPLLIITVWIEENSNCKNTSTWNIQGVVRNGSETIT